MVEAAYPGGFYGVTGNELDIIHRKIIRRNKRKYKKSERMKERKRSKDLLILNEDQEILYPFQNS